MKHVTEPSYGFQVADEYVTLLPEMVARPRDYILSSLYIDADDYRSKLALEQILEKELEDRAYPGLCNSIIPTEFSDPWILFLQ